MKRPICASRFTTPRLYLAALLAGTGLFTAVPALQAGDGTWTKTSGSWTDPGNWAGGVLADGTGFTATFGTELTADGVITLDGVRTIGNLTFGDLTPSNNWILNTGSSGPLTLDVATGASTITVTNQTATIAAALTGDDAVVKAGAGTLVLSNTASSLSGDFTVNGGILRLAGSGNGTNSSLGVSNVARNININAGATLQFANHDTFGNDSANPAFILNVNGGTVSNVGFNTFTTLGQVNLTNGTITSGGGAASTFQAFQFKNTVTSSGNSTISTTGTAANFNGFHVTNNTFNVTDGTLTVSAPLVNAGNNVVAGFTKAGAGTMVLSAVNTYTGNTLVTGGVLQVAATGSITNATKVVATAGGELVVNGTVSMANAAEFSIGSGVTDTTGIVTINTGGVLNVGGGGGYAVLGGRNSLGNALGAGTMNVNGGTVNIAAAGTGSSGPGGLDATSFWLNPYGAGPTSGGSFINLNAGTVSSARPVNDGGSGVSRFNYNGGTFQAAAANVTSNLTANVRNGGAKFDTQAFAMTVSGTLLHSAIGGDDATDGGLTKTGTGTLTLSSGASSFNGNVTINQGTVLLTAARDALNPTTTAIGDTQKVGRLVTINSGGTLSFGANDALGSTFSVSNMTLVVNGGTITNNGSKFVTLGAMTLNGGTVTGAGGVNGSYQMFNLKGPISVIGTAASTLTGTGSFGSYHLASPTIFDVLDVTGNAAADLVVSAPLINRTGNDGANPIGSLTKTGSGTMLLSGANLYTGPTTISGGTVLMNGTMAPGNVVTVADGAGYGRSSSGALSIASLSLGTGTTLYGNTGGPITIANADGFVVPAGSNAITVNVSGAPGVGVFPLVNYTGAFGGTLGTFTLGAVPSRTVGNLLLDATSLKFNVTSVDSARWSGAASGDWSTAVLVGTTNWVLNSNGVTQTNYLAADSVSFTDSAVNTAVTITAADVTPGGVTFNNTAKNYTLGGTKAIGGGTSLIKTGTGSLTITNVNTYTGGTQLNGGLVEASAGSLGTTGLISFGGGTLRYATGNTQDISARIANSTTAIAIDTNGNNLTYAGAIAATNTGGLIKSGLGSITMTAASSYTGDIVVNGGTIVNSVSANNPNPTATGLGNMTIAGRKITINTGGTVSFAGGNDNVGQYNYKTPVTFVVDGGTLSHGNQFVTIGDVQLKNGGTITGNNGVDPRFSGFNIIGTVTVSGTGASFLSTTGGTNPGTNLGTEANPNVTFDIGNTGAVGGDFIVTSPLLWEATAHTSGIIKTGPGTMVLNYNAIPNLYPGGTAINQGAVIVNGALNPITNVTVAAGAGFGRTAGGSVTVASLALAGNATLSVSANPATAATGSVIVTNADGFTAGGGAGSILVNLSGGGLTQGSTYTVLDYNGNFNGTPSTFALGTLPSRTQGNLVLNTANSSLDFVVTLADSLRWTGAASGDWSTAVLTPTKNFVLQSNSSQTDFLANDSVTFNDTATSKTVKIDAADVAIGVVKFDNAQAYTLTGAKGMTGAGNVTKTGTGTLTITNTNGYTGGTAINGGTVITGAGGLGTTGPVSFGGGSLRYAAGNTQDISARISNSTGVIKIDTNGNDLTFAGAIAATNTGGFNKVGAGTLTISTNGNAYTGDTVIDGGTVVVAAGLLGPTPTGTALGSTAVARQVVMNPGTRLEFRQHDILGNDAANPLITIVLNNSTLAAVSGSQASGNGPFNILPAITMNGGTLTSTNGAFDSVQSLSLKGTITVTGTTPSVINTTGTVALLNGIHLTQTGGNVFDVADVTSSAAVDLDASARFINRAGTLAASGIIKRGAGTMLLSNAANAYTGTTSVEAGTVLLNGSISGSDVTVAATGNFGGNGAAKSLLINAGGTLALSDGTTPGLGIGTLTLAGDAALFGTDVVDLKKTGITLNADLLSSTTQIVYGGNLNITFSGSALAQGDIFNLFDAPLLSGGTFANVNLPSIPGGLAWDTSKLGVDGTIAVVPEPGSVMLLLGGLGAVAGFRRRRRNI